jgi:hypothetical protein
MPARRDNWPNLLAQFIEQRREQPFAWGVNDCCTFAADWVQLCTGVDYAQAWRGRYASGLGAVRVLDEAGGVVALVDSLGLKRVPPQQAGRGDIVAQEAGHGITLGICLGATTVYVAKSGLIFGSLQSVESAWKF